METIKNNLVLILIVISMFVTRDIEAQKFNDLDKYPHDIAYFKVSKNQLPQVKVVYGRPVAKDTQVFGTQIPFGKLWNTGSNESTEIKFYHDVMVGNKFVKAGTYVLYTIPNKNYWTIILNSHTDTYGSYFYNPEQDVAKVEVPASKGEMVQNFSIAFNRTNYGSQMVLAWATTRVKVPLYMEESLITRL